MIDRYFLEVSVNVRNVAIAVTLNGVLLVEEREGRGYRETLPVNHWLKRSNNLLQVTLTSARSVGSSPAAQDSAPAKKNQVEVTLFLHDTKAETPKSALNLAQFVRPSNGAPISAPHAWSQSIATTLQNLPATRLWQYATPLDGLSQQDRQEMSAVVHLLGRSLSQKRLEEAFQLMQIRYLDEATAQDKDPLRLKNAVLKLWRDMLAADGIQYREAPADQLKFQIMGEQNLVQVCRADGSSALKFELPAEGLSYEIPTYFALISKRWMIVR
ncbi:MAG: hypothetical protein V4857_11685 [Pseudomonadota bacterium]